MCRERGIRTSYSAPYTPAHNGIAERNHGHTITVARTMLADATLDPENATFVKEAYRHAVFIHNITPHRALPDNARSPRTLRPWGTATSTPRATAPQMPSALLRSEPSAKVVMRIDRAAGTARRTSAPGP